MSDYKVVKVLYWSKSKKKNMTKQVNTKKFDGDEEKAREFLNKWKEEQKEKDMKAMNPDIEIKKEEITNEENKEIEKTGISEHMNIVENLKKGELPKIHITKFVLDLPNLKDDASSTVIFGSSKSGKTTQVMELLKKYYSGAEVIAFIISPNIHSKTYKPIKDAKYIKLDRWDDQLVKDVHKIQKKTKNKYAFLFCIDDCILEKFSQQMLQLFLVLRNSKINTILNLQSITLLSRNSRNNGQGFLFRNFNNDEIIEDAMKYFLGAYEPFYGLAMDDKKRLYKEATKNYGFIYLNALDGLISFHR